MANNKDKIQKLLLAKSIQELTTIKDNLEREIGEKQEIADQVSKWDEEKQNRQDELNELSSQIKEYGEAAKVIEQRNAILEGAEARKTELEEELNTMEESIRVKKTELDSLKATLGDYTDAQALVDAAELKKKEILQDAEAQAASRLTECDILEKEAEEEKRRIIEEAKQTAQSLIKDAENEKAKLLSDANETLESAKTQAKSIVEKAAADALASEADAKTLLDEARSNKEEMLKDAAQSAKNIIDDAQSKRKEYISNKQAEGDAARRRIIAEANSESERIIDESQQNANRIAESIKENATAYAIKVKNQAEKEHSEIINNAQLAAEKISNDAEKVMETARNYAESCRLRADEDAMRIRDEAEKTISETRNKLAADREALEKEKQRIADEKKRIAFENGRLDAREQDIENEIKERAWKKADAIEAEFERRGNLLDCYQKKLADCNSKLEKATKIAKGIDDPTEIKEELKKTKASLSFISEKGITTDNVDEFVFAKNEFDSIRNDNKQLHDTLTSYEQRLRSMVSCEKQLADTNEEKKYLTDMVNELTERLNQKKTVSKAEMIAPIHEIPACLTTAQLPACEFENEIDWLTYIKEKALNEKGLKFTDRQLQAFHTAQKTHDMSPLVVLAGVSGTGKSKLPESYSLYGGMNFLNIPVKPDWDSPASLFGYFNSIERRFEPTQLLCALYQMSDQELYQGQMLMVLLDEMNLAHPEQYFADLLSELEMNRGSKRSVKYNVALGGGQHENIGIGSNILWTGTMNEDETTKGLSDKVIDRSTLITFPRPKELENGKEKQKDISREFVLTRSKWDAWCSLENQAFSDIIEKRLQEYKINVELINNEMSHMGRNIGHRVWQGMKKYIIHHPAVVNARNETELADSLQMAFCDAIAFKIMPKLRGVELQGRNDTYLKQIRQYLSKCANDLIPDYDEVFKLPTDLFQWISSDFMTKQ